VNGRINRQGMAAERTCIRCGNVFMSSDPDAASCADCSRLLSGEPAIAKSNKAELVPPKVLSDITAEWQPGQVLLDTYEVKGKLGEGGMGKVYRVHHKSWNIDLAVKQPKAEVFVTQQGKRDFVREAKTWIDLGLHPHITSCYYVRTIEDVPHVFAECVEGGSLQKWIVERTLYNGSHEKVLERILDIAIQFAWGLVYAHEQGLVHQDVKPHNVLMTPEGVTKVTDFGLARARVMAGGELMRPGKDILVSAGGMTMAYRSPEQAAGKKLSSKTDMWSWGVSLLEMFNDGVSWMDGQVAGESLESYLQRAGEEEHIPPMPEALADLLRTCFQEDQAERPQNMLTVAGVLQGIYRQVTGRVYTRKIPKAVKLRADYLNNKALSLLDLEQPDEAVASWEKALNEDPHHPDATYNLGLWRWRLGVLSDVALVKQVSAVANTHAEYWFPQYLLGLVHIEREDQETAYRHLEQAAHLAPKEPQIQTALEQAHLQAQAIGSGVQVYEGHKNKVVSTSRSIDGSWVLSGDHDGQVRLWEITTGRCHRAFQAQKSLLSVYLSADGRWALTGGGGGIVKLWDTQTGIILREFEGHHKNLYITSVCMSDNLKWALSGSWDGTVRLWEVTTGKCLKVLRGHKRTVNSVCLSADGKIALSGGFDHSLRLWEIPSGRCLHIMEGHEWQVISVAVSADGRIALSTSLDELRVWDLSQGQCVKTIRLARMVGACGDLDSKGSHILCGTEDGTLQLWEIATGRCLKTWSAHDGKVNQVCFSNDGRMALSGGDDRKMKHWLLPMARTRVPYSLVRPRFQEELSQEETQAQVLINKGIEAIKRFEFEQALKHFLRLREIPEFTRAPESIQAWNQLSHHCRRIGLRAAWLRHSLEGHTKGVRDVSLRRDGHQAVSVGSDDTLRLWDLDTGKCLRTIEDPKGFDRVCISADGLYAVSAGGGNSLKLWELDTGACLRIFEGHNTSIQALSLSPDERWMLSGSRQWEGVVVLWDLHSNYPLLNLRGPDPLFHSVESVQFSPDGILLLAGFDDRTVRLWEVTTGRCLKTINYPSRVGTLKFTPNARQILASSEDNILRLWDLVNGDCLRTFADNSERIGAIDISTDGRFAISGGSKAIRVWDIVEGKCLSVLEGHTRDVQGVCFSPDGRLAVSASNDTTLRVWEFDWDLEALAPTDWDEKAQSYLEIFLNLHTPYATHLPHGRQPTREEITLALTRRGKPTWAEEDFQHLLYKLGCAGYGWLRPEGVRKKLEEMVAERG